MAQATEVINAFALMYRSQLMRGQRAKLGPNGAHTLEDSADTALADDWLALLHDARADFTLAW